MPLGMVARHKNRIQRQALVAGSVAVLGHYIGLVKICIQIKRRVELKVHDVNVNRNLKAKIHSRIDL